MNSRLIIALDLPDADGALRLAQRLLPVTPWLKVGLELFTATGPGLVRNLLDLGARIFLDLKFHDIPNTVRRATAAAIRAGAEMCNVHLAGGEAMCRAAVESVAEARSLGGNCRLLGVTVLTSQGAAHGAEDLRGQILDYAGKAKAWGLDGVVCSGQEAAAVKAAVGREFICLCPGIRLPGNSVHFEDQQRASSPLEAARNGADFLVAGRPVLQAADPAQAAVEILRQIEGAGKPIQD